MQPVRPCRSVCLGFWVWRWGVLLSTALLLLSNMSYNVSQFLGIIFMDIYDVYQLHELWHSLTANHCAACVYRQKSLKYERSADRQSAEIRTHQYTAYPIFIMLSAINSSLYIIPVMCCRNFSQNTSVFTLKYTKMLFNVREISD